MKWRCTWCGREYDTDVSSCGTCGRETFETVSEETSSPFEGSSIVWACTNCGREHVKHSPPCSRCGNHALEKRSIDDGEYADEISVPSYLAVGKPYLAGAVIVIVLVGLIITGVVPFPGINETPTPPNAPGDSDESAGLDLRSVEFELFERFEAERGTVDASERTLNGGENGVYIEYLTKHRVAQQYDEQYDGSMPGTSEFDLRCESQPTVGVVTPGVDISTFEDESAFADTVAEELFTDDSFRDAVLSGSSNEEAIRVHVGPDGTVFIGYLAC